MVDTILLTLLIFIAALLYSSVGHAGASGYLAAMGLFGLPQMIMRPAALCLNVFVASIGTYRFWKAGHLSWRLLWPFAVLGVPCAFLGGKWRLADSVYFSILGVVLLLAAANLIWQTYLLRLANAPNRTYKPPPIPVAMIVGGGLGMLAGLTGVGGGIFLSPVLILARWADPKKTAGCSIAFILLNSIAGLAGQYYSGQFNPRKNLPDEFLIWGAAAVCGGLIGSWLGARRFNFTVLRLLLAFVLVIAGVKLILDGIKQLRTRTAQRETEISNSFSVNSVDSVFLLDLARSTQLASRDFVVNRSIRGERAAHQCDAIDCEGIDGNLLINPYAARW